MKWFEVFYRKPERRPTVWHIDVQAHSKEHALEVAKGLLPDNVTIFRADPSPEWEVTPS